VERAIRTHSGSALTSHAAQVSIFTLLVALLGLSLSASALFIHRNPLLYYAVIFTSAALFAIAAGMLSRWFRKYGRRRSRHGQLARGQVPALFAFLSLLLQAVTFLALLILSSMGWRGF
jgi:Kef-type K+ transport system membrane component KefB